MPSHYDRNLFEISSSDAVNDLQSCLDEITKSSTEPTTDSFVLALYDVHITAPIQALLVQVLNHPVPKAPNATDFKWDQVEFHNCRILREGRTTRSRSAKHGQVPCTLEDLRLLATRLSGRISRTLDLRESPEILDCLFSTFPHLEMEAFSLEQEVLSGLQCQGLGGLIQRSVRLKDLDLCLNHLEEPQALAESFANAIHLQKLSITDGNPGNEYQQRAEQRADRIARHGGIDMVLRLVQNSQGQLQKLNISGMRLEDCDFMVIVEALPTLQLEELDVSDNNIHRASILALAAQLPRIKCLKQVGFGRNPWEVVQVEYEECCAALLRGLRENYSIEGMDAFERSSLASLSQFYCRLNRAGRRILATPNSVPAGLWPLILERAGKDNYHFDNWWDDYEVKIRQCRTESIYFFLRNSPVLSCICSSSFLRNSPRKKNKVMG